MTGVWNPQPAKNNVATAASSAPKMSWSWYVNGEKQAEEKLARATRSARRGNGFVWVGLRNPDEKMLREVTMHIDLHELAIEDILEGHTRSKMELFGDALFMVINTVEYLEHNDVLDTEVVTTGQVMVLLTPHYVLTIRNGGQQFVREMRNELEAEPEELAKGPWRVLYGILDAVVDQYTDVAFEMENDVQEVEAKVFDAKASTDIDRPYALKREVIEFKRAVSPLTAPLAALHTRNYRMIPSEAQAYFREVADHHLAARELITALDEVLTTILQAALALAAQTDNKDMRKISAAVAILAIPTTIGAIYGMNFKSMPELEWEYGYPTVLVLIFLGMAITWWLFRKYKWL